MAIDTTLEQVEALYVGYFGRAGEPNGVNYWVGQLNGGFTVSDMAASFAVQDEAKAEYPFLATPNVVTDPTAFINEVYQNLFGRAPDADGLNYWTGQLLARGGDSHAVGQFILDVISGAKGSDITALDNKAAAAEYYTQQLAAHNVGGTHLDANGHGVLDANLVASSHDAISGVTSDPATVTASEAATDAFIAGGGAGGVGQTFTLTTAIGENIHGTAGNDTFNAILHNPAATDTTLNNFDTITDTGGIDTLHILSDGTTALPAGAAISGVENIDFVFSANLGQAIHANNFVGSTHIDISGANLINVDGINGQVITGHSTALGNLTTAAGAASITAVLDKAQDGFFLNFQEAHAGDLTSVTVNGSVGTGAGPHAFGINVAPVTHVDTVHLGITNATSVVFNAPATQLVNVDAAASTGNLTMDLGAFTALQNVAGGSGNDTLIVQTNITKAETIAGNGGNDLIHIFAPAQSAAATSVSGGAGSDTFDFTALGNIKDTTHLANGIITIGDFKTTEDVLDLSHLGGHTRTVLDNTQLANIAGQATLEAAVTLAATLTGANHVSVFDFGGNAYAFNDDAAAGLNAGDGLVQLVGVHSTDFGAASLHTL